MSDIPVILASLPTWATDDSDLLGRAEAQDLEFKSEPWDVRTNRGKLEFAKDLSAMVNGGGGLIVLGVRTERQAHSAEDLSVELTPFPLEHIDAEQLKGLATSWLYPPQREITITIFPSVDESTGLASVFVRGLPDFDLSLIHGAEVEDGVVRRNFFGVARRFGDGVAHYSPDEIFRWIRDGRKFGEAGGWQRTDSEEDSLVGEDAASDLGHLLELYKDDEWPVIAIQIFPEVATRIEGLHDASGVKGAIANHETLRDHGGFNLRIVTGIESRSGYLEVNLGTIQRLLVSDRGCVSLVVSLSPSGMSWAMDQRDALPMINPIYLAEVVYDLASLYIEAMVPHLDPPPNRLRMNIGLFWADRPSPTGLKPGAPNWMSMEPAKRYEGAEWTDELSVDPSASASTITSAILRRIYGAFGLGVEAIPFFNGTTHEFDVDLFLEPSGR